MNGTQVAATLPAGRHRDIPASKVIHPWPLRVMHWLNAVAIIMLIGSGWQIYNASPFLPFTFPEWATIGEWLGGAIAWHLAAIWLLMLNGLTYLIWGFVRGHFRKKLWPVTPRAVLHDAWAALRFRLPHEVGVYNAVQRLLYLGVIALGILAVLSGLAVWKPVQAVAALRSARRLLHVPHRAFHCDDRHSTVSGSTSAACGTRSPCAATDDHRWAS